MVDKEQRNPVLLDVPEAPPDERQDARYEEKWVNEVVGVFCDPVVVYPSPWQADIPKWLFGAITTERLIMEMKALKGEEMMATDAEVVAYMMPRTMDAPLPYEWTEIYCYEVQKVMKFHKNQDFPKDLQVKELSDYWKGMLLGLKRDIYRTRLRARAERRRGDKKELAAAAPAQDQGAPIVQQTFDFAT